VKYNTTIKAKHIKKIKEINYWTFSKSETFKVNEDKYYKYYKYIDSIIEIG